MKYAKFLINVCVLKKSFFLHLNQVIDSSDVVLQVGYEHRSDPLVLQNKRSIASKLI